MNLLRLPHLVAATALLLTTFPLHADILLPGGSGSPEAFPNPGDVAALDHIHGTFNFGSGALTGSYDEFVLVDPLGITCSGCLDFAIFINVSSGSIETFGVSSFAGFTTDVGYVSGTGGNADPSFVSRFGANGAVIGFRFDPNLVAGQSTDALVIATNATGYDTRGIAAMNLAGTGGVAEGFSGGFLSGPFFEPVPEPSAAWLLSLAVMGIAAFRKKTQ